MQSLAYFQDQLVVQNEYFSDFKNTILGRIMQKIYSTDFYLNTINYLQIM